MRASIPRSPARPPAPRPPRPRPTRSRPARPRPPACAGCHGDTGISKTPGMPSLVGLDPKYLVAAMNAYKNGQRKHDMMKTMLVGGHRCGHRQHRALLCAAKARAGADAARRQSGGGQGRGGRLCRMPRRPGRQRDPANPSLAGQDAQYFAAALRAYKDGSRNDDDDEGAGGVARRCAPSRISRPTTPASSRSRRRCSSR